MSWTDNFSFPGWDLIGWVVILAAWFVWEIWGATHDDAATFTYLVRNSVKPIFRLIAWLALGWHFLWWDTAWWKAFINWCWRW